MIDNVENEYGKDHRMTTSAIKVCRALANGIEKREVEIMELEIRIDPMLGENSDTSFAHILNRIINEHIMQVKNADYFKEAVHRKKNPRYYEVIKNPMHLALIKRKIKRNSYQNVEDFINDLRIMRQNTLIYHGPVSEITIASDEIVLSCKKCIQEVFKIDLEILGKVTLSDRPVNYEMISGEAAFDLERWRQEALELLKFDSGDESVKDVDDEKITKCSSQEPRGLEQVDVSDKIAKEEDVELIRDCTIEESFDSVHTESSDESVKEEDDEKITKCSSQEPLDFVQPDRTDKSHKEEDDEKIPEPPKIRRTKKEIIKRRYAQFYKTQGMKLFELELIGDQDGMDRILKEPLPSISDLDNYSDDSMVSEDDD
ncbi:hypothetical protein ACOME3_004734 [Neoechinorhynchus agilis]